MSYGGFGQDLSLAPSGDYCSYYGTGDELTLQNGTNQAPITGDTTPEPFGGYQEGDPNGSVCQAAGSHWGQEVRTGTPTGLCKTGVCGMHHYVSLSSQGAGDRPWSEVFGAPSLVLSTEAEVQTFTHSGTSYGGWGYVCPELEDTTSHGVIEYCFQEWRSTNDTPEWKNERRQECNKPFSQVNTYFYPGTQYATEMPGSTNTYETASSGSGRYEAEITSSNLAKAAHLVNATCEGWHLSENPTNYALIGVEQGLEGYHGVTVMGGSSQNLQLRTDYTLRLPTVSNAEATNPQELQVTLSGAVNPNASDTRYYFQYGKTTAYGSNTPTLPGVDIGSGVSNYPVSANVTDLTPGENYHFRLVATNAAGTTYGGDHEVRARGSARSVYYNGGGSLEESYWNGREWGYVPLHHAISGDPSAGTDSFGRQFVFYSGGVSLEQSSWNGSEWGYVPLGHAISGNPAAAVNSAGEQWAFYNGGGSLEESWWNGKEWGYAPLHHAIVGSPGVGIDSANHEYVFYNGGGSLEESAWNGKEWEYVPLHHAITGNPAVGVDAAGHRWAFYNGGGSLEESWWNGKEWGYAPLHHAIVGSPATVVDSAGEQFVVYNGGGSLEESHWNGKEWEYVPLHHAIVGSPAIVINPHTGEQWIFYNGGGSLEESAWNGKEWEYVPLHHAMTGDPTAIANTGNLE